MGGIYKIEDLPQKKYTFDWQMDGAVKKYSQFYIIFENVISMPVKIHKQLCKLLITQLCKTRVKIPGCVQPAFWGQR